MKDNIIDVTTLPPPLKHPTIFQKFDGLHDGETLTIHNDHDPKPLYYQLLHERGEVFNWAYLEEGPQRWIVQITKEDRQKLQTVGQIAASDWRKAEVFKRHGIDFCCGGRKTLQQICSEKKISLDQLEAELLKSSDGAHQRALPYNEWSAAFLADYIVNTHHTFVRKSLPELRGYARKVAMVHGEFHPELREIDELIEALDKELSDHMRKEENILFPYIKELADASELKNPPFGTVSNPIRMMEHEHDAAGQILQEIRTLSADYRLPSDACASYSLLYKMLEEFEADLHVHIHLENNILFPRAIELEKQLTSAKNACL